MTIGTIIRKICCCEGEFSEDEQMLVEEDDDGTDILPSRGATSRESLTNVWVPGSGSNSVHGTPVMRDPQTDNEEEQMLKAIINTTRQNIVVIGNANELAPNSEEIARARRYQDIVKQHDSRLWKLHPPSSADAYLVDSSGLKDVGERISETLLGDPLSREHIHYLKDTVKRLSEAAYGMQVEHRQEIIVHMPLDEDVVTDE